MTNEASNLQERAIRDYNRILRSQAYHDVVAGNREPVAQEAALFFAQVLGYCRLWGANLGNRNGTIYTDILPLICQLLKERIEAAQSSLESYERDMDLVRTREEAELYSITILQQRMDAWAMWIAIDERIRKLISDQDRSLDAPKFLRDTGKTPFELLSRQLMDAIAKWDRDLQARSDLLVEATGSPRFHSWISALASPWKHAVPWWLNETRWHLISKQYLVSEVSLSTASDSDTTVSHAPGSVDFETWPVDTSAETPTLSARALDSAARTLHFQSSQRRGGHSIAEVTVPGKFTIATVQVPGSQSVVIDQLKIEIRFLFPEREPEAVRVGTVVSLGRDASSVIVMDLSEHGTPEFQATITVSRGQYKRLQLGEHLRLRVGTRFWLLKPAP